MSTTRNNSHLPNRWTTKNEVTISRSSHHNDLFIFSYPDGKWFAVSGGHELMYRFHPPKEKTKND